MKTRKKVLSLFLTLAMVLTLLPMTAVPAAAAEPYAATVEVDSESGLKAALERTDNILIKLTGSIDIQYDHKAPRKSLPIVYDGYVVRGKKALDLNGKTISFTNINESAGPKAVSYLFGIPRGASLHMMDSAGGGLVKTDGYMTEDSNDRFDHANIFGVEGTLVIDSGEYIAGRSKKVYVPGSAYYRDSYDNLRRYHGYAYRMIGGTVISNSGGKVVINGGKLDSVGSGDGGLSTSYYHYVLHNYDEGEAVINGGHLLGYAGSSCFWNRLNSTLVVNGGTFDTTSRWVLTDVEDTIDMRVDNEEGSIGLDKEEINPLISGYHYDGRDYLPSDMKEGDFSSKQQILTIYPGKPDMSLSPEVEDGFYLLAKDAPYTITASAERYYTDIGLGRESILEYTVGENYQVRDWDAEFSPDTSAVSYRNYTYEVTERLPWQKQTDPDRLITTIPFAVKVTEQDLRPILWLEIVGWNDRYVPLNQPIQLRALAQIHPQEDIIKYEWYDGNGTLLATKPAGDYHFTVPTDTAGEFSYMCAATNKNGAVGYSRYYIIYVADQMAPSLLPGEVFLKYNVKTDEMLLPRNIGGAADSFTYEGTIPAGLQFFGDTGFTGTPTESGRFPVTMKATNKYGTSLPVAFTIVVSEPVNITTESIPTGILGDSYTATLATDGGGDIVWSLAGGALPDGLTLGTRNGQITGSPTKGGEFKFTARVQVTGYAPVTKEFTLTIHEKPVYPATVTKTVTKGRLTTIASPLTAGASEPGIQYWLVGSPEGVSVIPAGEGSAGALRVNIAVEGTYKFELFAKNDYGQASTNVTIKVENAPSFNTSYIEPEMGEVGVPFDTGSLEEHANYTANECVWELDGSSVLPAGLAFDPNTGRIFGTPTQDTGLNDKGYPAIHSIEFNLKDTDTGVESTFPLYVWLRIAAKGTLEAPTFITISDTDYATGVNEWIAVKTDGIPKGAVTLESGQLPPGLSLYDDGESKNILGSPLVKGTYNFTLQSKNDLGSVSQAFTVTVSDPVKAAAPTVTPAPGVYTKGDTLQLVFKSPNGDGYVKYSINGGAEQTYLSTSQPVEISADAVITAYVDTAGYGKLNSDVVTFRYTFVDDPNVVPPITTITSTALADGLIDTPYVNTDLTATTTGTDPITWTASGLPNGMELSTDGKLTGTPTEAGTFNVNLLATAGSSDSKTLELNILQPPAATPTITSQPTSATYKLNAAASALTVAASTSDGGAITYQWYRSNDDSNATKADDVMVGSGDEFTPPTNMTGKKYYYAVATNRKAGFDEATVTSNVAEITITFDAATPIFDDMDDYIYTFTEGTQAILRQSAEVQDSGTLTYKWYKMTGSTKDPAVDTPMTGGENGELEITVAAAVSTEKYYTVATNTNNNATGEKVITAIGPFHVVNSIEQVLVTAIKVTALPTKTSYYVGDTFDPAGMVVTATYSNNSTKDLTAADYTYTPTTALALTDGIITVSYTDPVGEATFTAGLPITVAERSSSGGGGGVSTYTLTFNTNGGFAISSVSKSSGTTVDLVNYKPTKTGYDFAGWYSDNALTAKVTSVKLTKNTTVYAKWTAKNPDMPFVDVPGDAYYKEAVEWAVKEGITSGTTATTFDPNGICTRAQAVTFLWRANGEPEPTSTSCSFTDVDTDAYYYKAVLWATEKGIVKGTSTTTFSPNDNCTRAQIVTLQYRTAGSPAAGTVNPFTDVSADAYYANAVLWAVKEGITQGTTATTFSPDNNCTRAQIVTFLYRQLGK